MSRSYKKHPFVTDGYGGDKKQSKRIANRKVRRKVKNSEDMPARLQHKKMTESYNICDYKWRMTKEEAITWYLYHAQYKASTYFLKRYPTLDAWLNYWEKCHRRK